MLPTGLIVLVTASVLSCAGTLFMRRQAIRFKFLDVPTARKDHGKAMPLGGGIAMYAAFVLTIAAGYLVALSVSKGWRPSFIPSFVIQEAQGILDTLPRVLLIVGVGTGMVILGLVDDAKNLSAPAKLIVQAALATILVIGGIRVTVFIPHKLFGGAVTVLWIIGVMNAFNFLDNMDGLCAGVALVAGTIFMSVALQTDQFFVALMLLAYMGMLAGFLIFNFPPASIFMGDAGSMFVGYILAVLTVVFTFLRSQEPAHRILTPLMILALPLFDMMYVAFVRLYTGSGLFKGDHNHVSHRLVSLGMTPRNAALTIYLMTFCTGLAAIMLRQMSPVGAMLAVAQVISFLVLIFLVEGAGRRT
jgi:UDP-GlcNAc:undecaprenyl-phosphate GlcNAc-1-phosphate transferase